MLGEGRMAALVREIQSVKGYVDACGAVPLDNELREGFVNALIHQINQQQCFNASDAEVLTTELKGAPYGDDGHARITNAIRARMKASLKASPPRNNSGLSQSLKHIWNYLTQSDWDFIRHPKKHLEGKMARVLWRLNLLGCCHASEQSLKWILALLAICCYETLPGPQVLYNKLQDLKACKECEKNHNIMSSWRSTRSFLTTFRKQYISTAMTATTRPFP